MSSARRSVVPRSAGWTPVRSAGCSPVGWSTQRRWTERLIRGRRWSRQAAPVIGPGGSPGRSVPSGTAGGKPATRPLRRFGPCFGLLSGGVFWIVGPVRGTGVSGTTGRTPGMTSKGVVGDATRRSPQVGGGQRAGRLAQDRVLWRRRRPVRPARAPVRVRVPGGREPDDGVRGIDRRRRAVGGRRTRTGSEARS